MAADDLITSFKEEFDTHQLTCSVCLDQYTSPKILHCHHSFCLKCIEHVPLEKKDGEYYIRCPTCRVDHILPQGGANSLPNDSKVIELLHLRRKLSSGISMPKLSNQCRKHNNVLKAYCETCCKIICSDCTISTEHNEHIWFNISECYPKHHQQILDNLDLVKHKLADMNTAIACLDTREREVVEQGENVKEQINTHAQELIENIQRSRTHLTQQVNTIVQQKTQTLATQRQQVQKLHTQLKTCQNKIEQSLKEWNQQQILAQKSTLMDKINTCAVKHIDPAMLLPIEDANIQLNKTDRLGSITRIAYGKATLEVSPCTAKQPSTATLTLHSQNGSPFSLPPSLISSTLSSPGNNHSVKCPIIQTQLGKYSITFTPSTRNDQLIVQVGGVDVPDSPFTLPVISTERRSEPINIITGLDKPCSIVVCTNGDIVVTEFGSHCVTILNEKGEKVKSFGQFNHPRGVAISFDGHILVTDNHRLQKLTTDGVCIKAVGSRESGRGKLQFTYPNGIAVHPATGQIFVADSINNRIQVFKVDLTFSHTISPTQLDGPRDIAIDNEGYLYIADNGNHCIFKISCSTRNLIKKFSYTPDSKPINPYCLAIHNNQVLVSEYDKNCIFIFDTDGKFYGGRTVLNNKPQNVSTDSLGNLYISDMGSNRIVVM